MHQTVVINVVGLSEALLGEHTPHLLAFARNGARHPLRTVTPAVTCTVQSTFHTGSTPASHGIVANGWYFRDLAQIWFWRQSNQLVAGEKIWEAARRRDPGASCANMFWWYNMYSSVDHSVTPRPIYPADGRKIPGVYSEPAGLADKLEAEIGEFPFFHFWGPKADIRSSEWIAEASRRVFDWQSPALTLIYLPHLDYNLQRFGPEDPRLIVDLRQIDEVCEKLIAHFQERGARVIVLSEYGITSVNGAIHINRILREAGFVRVRKELGLEMLDAGASAAFAVSDHQVAHVYVSDADQVPAVKRLLESVSGIEVVLDEHTKGSYGLNHHRSGELVAIAERDKWFTYYYWLDDNLAPDFARTVDIHRKPGYDPCELFLDPEIRFPALKIGRILLQKSLGFRYLMDVIPLDSALVKGSHGRVSKKEADGPVFISSEKELAQEEVVRAEKVKELILDHLFRD